jgi:hypothetical protein
MCRRAGARYVKLHWDAIWQGDVVHTGHIKNATNYLATMLTNIASPLFQFCDDDVSKLPRLIARESNQLSRAINPSKRHAKIIRVEKSMNLDLGSSAFGTADYFLRTNANA